MYNSNRSLHSLKNFRRLIHIILITTVSISSCKKENNTPTPPPPPPPPTVDSSGTLKDAADYLLGIAIDYTPFKNDAAYRALVAREADNVTFSYNMKHGAIVRDDGSFNYTVADEMFNLATSNGLMVFGHTLAWHENQNANYLKSLTTGVADPSAPDILANGNFETGTGSSFTNWSVYNTNGATISAGSGTEVRNGSRSLKIINPNNFPGEQWKVQIASDLINTKVNDLYKVSFWIKSANAGGSGRLSTQPTAQYQSDFATTTNWTEVSWTFTAKDAQTRILFDMGAVANTYFIDDVTVKNASPTGTVDNALVAAAVDTALSRFIRNTVTRYAGKIKAWDVVNEAMADGNSGIRTSTNTATSSTATDRFFWADYLGRDFALKAFNYAKAADPAALLFINDYNLEYSNTKLDSLVNFVQELKTKGAKVDGVGTQMHISIATPKSNIDNMFQKLAATGLKVRVSELDIRINPSDVAGFTATPANLNTQSEMYKYVVQSYLKYVPATQRYGITVWGVNDKDSWIVAYQKKTDFPLLFKDDYSKKPAFYGFLFGLKGK